MAQIPVLTPIQPPIAVPQQTAVDRARLFEANLKFAGSVTNMAVREEQQKQRQRDEHAQTSRTAPSPRSSGVQLIDALRHPTDPQDHMGDRPRRIWPWPFRRRDRRGKPNK